MCSLPTQLLLALPLFLHSCGGESLPALERLRLEPVPGTLSERRAEIVHQIDLPTVLGERCQASNDSVELIEVNGAAVDGAAVDSAAMDGSAGSLPAVRFARPELATNLRIFRSIDPGKFDLVRMRVAAKGPFLIRVLAQRRGTTIESELRPQVFTNVDGGLSDDYHVFELEFPKLRAAKKGFAELVLHKAQAASPVTITSLELVDRGGTPLPAPDLEPQFVATDFGPKRGMEARPAIGLEGEVVLQSPLPAGTGEFVFDARNTEGAGGSLRASLYGSGRQVLRSHDFELGSNWRVLRLALRDEEDSQAAVSVTVHGLNGIRALVSNPRIERRQPTAPTVLLITSDTHRADHLGFSSPPGFVETPHLDALKQEGVTFLDCYSQSNVTNPSHVALMTALHPRDSGVVNNFSTLADRALTLSERFSAAGYATLASVSAEHLSAEHSGLRQGFDRVGGPQHLPLDAAVSVARLESWLDDYEGVPVFAWLHLFDAHFPYTAPDELIAKYYPEERDPRQSSLALPQYDFDVHNYLTTRGITDPEYAPAIYRAEIDSLDAVLGSLFDRPRIRDGILAFTADHGELLGTHGVYCGHLGLYPATLHVPLVLRWPGGPRDVEINEPVEMFDLGRTLLNLAGLRHAAFPGVDLTSKLKLAESAHVRTAPRFALAPNGTAASLVDRHWMAVLHLRGIKRTFSPVSYETGQLELFDLTADPGAEVDLVLEDLARAKGMRSQILAWLAEDRGTKLEVRAADLREDQVELLADLGYAGMDDTELPERPKWWRPAEVDPRWNENPWRRLFEEEGFGPDEFREADDR